MSEDQILKTPEVSRRLNWLLPYKKCFRLQHKNTFFNVAELSSWSKGPLEGRDRLAPRDDCGQDEDEILKVGPWTPALEKITLLVSDCAGIEQK